VPITQQRMIDIVEESERMYRWAAMLHNDMLTVLKARDLAAEAKVEALYALIATSPAPACVKCAVERDHFRRSQRRNARSAERMRAKRIGTLSTRENSHGQ
jgi:hypothetical protein